MVHELTAVCPHLADSLASPADNTTNNLQPKPTDPTDRNEATHELAKITKNSRLLGSSQTDR
jgi:hypothetical protein